MVELAVELYGTPIGTLVGSGHDFDFHPSADGLSRFGLDSTVLSVAIPLAAVQPRTRKKRRQNFFQELLPEGEARSVLARLAPFSAPPRVKTRAVAVLHFPPSAC